MKMEYKCFRCGYETIYKKDVKRHLLRKKVCNPIVMDIDRRECFKVLDGNKDDLIKMLVIELKNVNHLKIVQEKDLEICRLNNIITEKDKQIENLKLDKNHVEEKLDECVYLLLEREFIKTPIKIVKIGRSTCFKTRMRDYPKGSKILYTSKCDDSVKAEKELLVLFNIMFKQRKDAGTEYFEGDPSQMIKQIQGYFYNTS
jgi:hypothetical protein